MTLGPILFLQPLALLGLLALPILWLLLRATPPEPTRSALPSLALMEDLRATEETPARTPWWLLLLRMAALSLVMIGFARPTLAPSNAQGGSGGTLIVVDDGWTSAERWRDMVRNASAAIDEVSTLRTSLHVLFTAPREQTADPSEALDFESARQMLRDARPAPWLPDRAAALKRLADSGLKPGRIIWISDGFDHTDAVATARALAGLAPTEVRITRPKGAFVIASAKSSAEGARVEVRRALTTSANTFDIVAETEEGASLGSARAEFPGNALSGEALFQIPAAALNRVARFRIAGSPSAGAVWLWDDASRRPHVGIADARDEAQPLLSEHYYVRKALQPYADITERSLADLLKSPVDAIIVGDRGAFSEEEVAEITAWIEKGGAFIRFAGPRLAATPGALTPTPLRPASRALGGALAWETPQKIAPFPMGSPFTGLQPPADVVVRQQVLAQPSSDMATYTWASLVDGTPLVTAERRGQGELILFHVTADPDWSDLPYSGAFVEMLRRAAISGGQDRRASGDLSGSLTPVRVLDGFGQMTAPASSAASITADDLANALPSPQTPPGLYAGPAGERALNAGQITPGAVSDWPAAVTVSEQAAVIERRGLGGWMIALGLALFAADLLIALAFAGKLGRGALAAAGLAALLVLPAPNAQAQSASSDTLAREAASRLRLAYVRTGDNRLDEITRAGLFGLSYQLGERTSVEPDMPHGVDLTRDALEFYPMIYYSVPRNAKPLPPAAVARVNAYLRNGGALVVDTRDAAPGRDVSADLETLLAGIDAPPLQPTPPTHVITKSYYLLKSFPGRLNGRLWIEASSVDRNTRRGDGVSGLFIGGSDWAGAWAIDPNGKPLLTMEGGDGAREMAYRFGINLVMYILTGNYKEDQVHVPDLLERLGQKPERPDSRQRPE
jgi:hypothetical protein